MNKVVTINLNGNACQLEEGAYEVLRAYLAQAGRALEGNPDRAEILADIEQAVADRIRAALGAYKTVAATAEVERIIAEMGPVDGGAAQADPEPAAGPRAQDGPPPPDASRRRLYRLREGAMIGGVCNGIAGYFGFDPTWIRLLFAALAFATLGVMALIYVVLLLVVPRAETAAEKEAASGASFTAQEFIRRARAGYYEGMRAFGDKRAHREWRWKFKREMREWRHNFRREMRENARAFRGGWHPYSPRPRLGFVAGMLVGLCSLCRWVLGLAFFFAFLCLICTGGIFGFVLPYTVPFWLGLVLLIVAYQVLALPFKVLKHAALGYGGWGGPWASPGAVLVEAAGSVLLAGFFLWLAARIFPGLHEVLYHLPQALRELGHSLQAWWNSGR
ncbi:MAG TPA: PspC domain-containing protein [Opitutaceae bacterium]|jgi:phage shock protein PspC (stress-responsive transcriptional regulator)|nr:PspC domain-containing protein [Opitutaceae bacterium]